MRKQLVFAVVLLAACHQAPPKQELPGLAVDSSRYRFGGSGEESPTVGTRSWFAERVGGNDLQPPIAPPEVKPDAPREEIVPAPPRGNPHWQLELDAPVDATPAVYLPAWPSHSNLSDRLYTVVKSDGLWVARIYHRLYDPAPAVCADILLDAAVDGSAVSVTADGQTFFVATANGTIYGISNPSDCTGGFVSPKWTVHAASGISHSSPWIDLQSNTVFAADVAGNIYAVDAESGVSRSGFPVDVSVNAFHSTPLVYQGQIWIGDDGGQLFRLSAVTGQVLSAVNLCDGNCDGDDALYATPFIDVANGQLITASSRRLISVDIGSNLAVTKTFSDQPGVIWSSPTVDLVHGFVYIGYDDQLFKVGYPLTSGSVASHAWTRGISLESSYPRSTPMVDDDYVFIGDGGGYLDRFPATGETELRVPTASAVSGQRVDASIVGDFVTGGYVYYSSVGAPGRPTHGSVNQLERDF